MHNADQAGYMQTQSAKNLDRPILHQSGRDNQTKKEVRLGGLAPEPQSLGCVIPPKHMHMQWACPAAGRDSVCRTEAHTCVQG